MSAEGRKRVLLLGGTGKLGRALAQALAPGHETILHSSRTFDAGDFEQVRGLVRECRPAVVFNAVAFLGIDACEREPEKALRLNSLYPRVLAQCAAEQGFVLAHFSTDAVFGDRERGAWRESDAPAPVNVYGLTKYGGDCFVRDLAPRSYVFRVPLLFGPTDRRDQFVERMLGRVAEGARLLRIADDILVSPSATPDVAAAAVRLVSGEAPFGLYHLANRGEATLFELISRLTRGLGSDVRLEPCSHRDFPSVGKKNTRTPMVSEKIPPLRAWEEAADEYCRLRAAERRA